VILIWQGLAMLRGRSVTNITENIDVEGGPVRTVRNAMKRAET
jgi:hypothetical protein